MLDWEAGEFIEIADPDAEVPCDMDDGPPSEVGWRRKGV